MPFPADEPGDMYVIPLTSKTSFRRMTLTSAGDFHVKVRRMHSICS
jgi:hypothetical protein